jgi:acyl-CoA thioester hydrolase
MTEASAQTSWHDLLVRFCETDLMRIVHHANYLIYCESARVDWLHKRGVSYENWLQHGVHLPVVRANIHFKMAAQFDDHLRVETTMAELTRATVRFTYCITRGDDVICQADTLLACVNDELRVKRIPAEVAEVFQRAENA